ncbi:restriction endonuclease subunit S [Flagellimonas sp.]|uniref:restriction endonuclease subunit S n=1 Tax=Flagellimonas sp. TaxID=2058762 RepID=UPI003B50FBF0
MSEESNIPKSWIWSNLGEITLTSTKTNKKKEKSDNEFLYIDINAIDNKSFKITEPKLYTWSSAPSRAQQIVKENDIVFSTVRPYLKNIAFVEKKYHDEIASTGFCVIRPVLINPKYVFYYVLSNKFINKVNSLAKGTSYPAVTSKVVFNQRIPIPPLNEQQRIVDKIEELVSDLDNGHDKLKLAQRQLKIYRQALLKNAFEGKLTEQWRQENKTEHAEILLKNIQEGRKAKYEHEVQEWKSALKLWKEKKTKGKKPKTPRKPLLCDKNKKSNLDSSIILPAEAIWTKVGCIAEIEMGQSPPGESYNTNGSGTPLINGPSEFGDSPFSKTQKIKWTTNPTKLCKEGDLILCVRGSTTGRQNIAGFEACIGRGVCSIKSDGVLQEYLNYFFYYSNRKVLKMGTGTTFPSISREQITEFDIPLFSFMEQVKIVELLEKQFSIIDNLEKVIQSNLNNAQALHQSILKKAFEGKLVDQNSDDESASDLLDRIKLERTRYLEKKKQEKKKAPKKMKKTKMTLLDIIKSNFSKESFTYSELKDQCDLSYVEIKTQLFELLEKGENLKSSFDSTTEEIKYSHKP